MKKITKAVIPAAGLGTRFLPATKTIPKELLPIVNKPILLYVVEEAVEAGIEDIVIIAGRGKTAIEDFFDSSYELEDVLTKQNKTELLEPLLKIKNMANIISIRQKYAGGLGHAVLSAQPVIGDEPFAVLLGDEISVAANSSQITATKQLTKQFQEIQASVVSVIEVEKKDVHKYGIIKGCLDDRFSEPIYKVTNVVEKPSIDEAPSQLALPGRYVFDAQIFKHLKQVGLGRNHEIQLTDAMSKLAQNEGLFASKTNCNRYDAGDQLGFLKANIELALTHPKIADNLKTYLKLLANTF